MSVIVLGEGAKEKLLAAKRHAKEHPFTLEMLVELQNKQATVPLGQRLLSNEHFAIVEAHPNPLEVGVTYEFQPPLALWHCSFNFVNSNRLPNPSAVDFILMEMGLPSTMKAYEISQEGNVIHLWFEDEKVVTQN